MKKSRIIAFCAALFIAVVLITLILIYLVAPVMDRNTTEWRFKDITDQIYETQYAYAIEEVDVHVGRGPTTSFSIYITFESLNADEMHTLGCDIKEILDRDFRETTERHNGNSRDVYLSVVSKSSEWYEKFQVWNFHREGDYNKRLGRFYWYEEFKSQE